MFWFGKRKSTEDKTPDFFEEFRNAVPGYTRNIDRINKLWKKVLVDCFKHVKT